MSLTAFSIKHNVAVVLLCIGLVAIGLFCYFDMSRESFPDVEFPYVIVTTRLEGANPTDVEQSVTIPLETELDGVEGLKEMRSASLDSMSMISLEFHPGIDKEVALRRARDAVDQAKPDLSAEAEEPVVKEFSMSSIPVVIYHLVATGDRIALSELHDLAEKVEDEIKTVAGVLDVDVFGARDREILIEVDPERLHFYHLSLAQVQAILRGTNRNISAGSADGEKDRVVVRVPGEFRSPAEIFGLVVAFTPEGSPVYMRDVASVRYDFEDEESRARLYDFTVGGADSAGNAWTEPNASISLHVTKRVGTNVLDMCRSIDERLAGIPFPPSVRVVKGLDMSKDVEMMVSDLENGIGTSLVLVVLVMFVGLGAMNALLVATAIPFSMLLSIIVLHATGQTLNTMVLFSLIMSLGMLVDNAIVIVENIHRHYSLGMSRTKAAITGTMEVMWPVVASTATTVGAFLPLLFWPGIMGEFMSYLPRTVIIVLLSSLFVALVINPTLAAMLMRIKPGARTTIDPESHRPTYWLVQRYQVLLRFFLGHRRWTLVTSVLLLVLTLVVYAGFGAGVELFPPTDPDNVSCSISPPEGISLAESDRLCRAMEERVFGKPGSGFDAPVANLKFASVVVGLAGVGGGGGGLQSDNSGPVRVQVEFVDRELRTESTMETLRKMRLRLEGLDADGRRVAPPLLGGDYDVLKPEEGPPTGSAISVDVFGEDLNEMTRVVNDMKRLIAATAGTVKPTDDAVTAQPTIEWIVDRARAGMHGLEQLTVGSTIQIAVGGLITGTFGHGDDEQDIRLRLPRVYRFDLDRMQTLTIPMVGGQAVPVASTASARLVPGPVTIKHQGKRRVLNASADVQPGIRQDSTIRKAFQDRVKDYRFPPGISHAFGGKAEEEADAKAFLGKAFAVALFLILMILVIQFNSVLVSGIVLCSVVMSLMGVFLGLLAIRAPFGIIMTGIGVISLAGVVVNNAIVLLDAIAQFEQRGQDAYEATVSACMVRFRPVLLTAVTTILGLLPMALKLNWDFRSMTMQFDTKSSQWWQSMSLAIIFGLLVATVLTLGIVPSLYLTYARHRDRRRGRGGQPAG